MGEFYKMNKNGSVELVGDVTEWSKIFNHKERHVATTENDGFYISTIFLGLDHSHGSGSPLFFETMVFKKPITGEDIDMDRYSTKDQALKGHKRFVKKYIKASIF